MITFPENGLSHHPENEISVKYLDELGAFE